MELKVSLPCSRGPAKCVRSRE